MSTNFEVEMFERVGKLVEQNERLAVALANLIPRFQRALIQSGTDAEYAEEATREHRRALEFARQP